MKTQTKFKQTEIGMIPEGWEVKSISELSGISLGGTPSTTVKEYWDGKIKWASAKDISNAKGRYVYDTERRITEKGIANSAAKILPKNTIIITSRGTVGEMAMLSEPMSFNQTCYGLKAKTVNDIYLYYRLKSAINHLKQVSYGTVFNTITMRTFDEIKLPIPTSENEQSSIAKILSDLDSKIELNQQMNATLEAIGQTLFKHWFIDYEFQNEKGKPYKSSGGEMVDSELGEIPKGWKVGKIEDEFKTVLGGTPSTTNKPYWENGTVAWINSGKINEFRITEPTAYITEEAVNNSATKLLPKGTTVLAITGATLGQVSRIEISTCANQSVIGIIESENIHNEYIYFWIKYTIDEIIRHQTGGAQQHINKNNVDNSKILIPSAKVIQGYQKVIKTIFDKISLGCFEIKELSQIRDSLLPRLMSGKIRVGWRNER